MSKIQKRTQLKKFLRFRLGLGKRISFSYRFLYWQCEFCGKEELTALRGKGRIRETKTCRYCGDRAHLTMIEKHKITRL